MSPWTPEALARSEELRQLLEGETPMVSIECNVFWDNPKRHIKVTAESFEELADQYVRLLAFAHDFIDESPEGEWLPGHNEPLEEEPPYPGTTLRAPVAPQDGQGQAQAPVAVLPVRPVTLTRPSAGAVRCGLCNGAVYDEHKSKFWGNGLGQSGNAKPGWKCQGKAPNAAGCTGRAWDEYDPNTNQWTGIGEWQVSRL